MKKILLVVFAVMFFAGVAFGAAATVSETEFGYSITGGVTTTAVAPTMKALIITSIEFQPAALATSYASFTSAQVSGSQVACAYINGYISPLVYGNGGCMFKNMEVTLQAAGDKVFIHVAGKIPN